MKTYRVRVNGVILVLEYHYDADGVAEWFVLPVHGDTDSAIRLDAAGGVEMCHDYRPQGESKSV